MIALDQFREWAGWHPWKFWGLGHPTLMPDTSKCVGRLPQHAWQDADTISRDDISDAITLAMDKLKTQLGYNVIPLYDEITLPYPRPYNTANAFSAPIDATGRWIGLSIDNGYIQALGIEALTLVQANVPITYSDLGSDGINDVWSTAAIATTITDPMQIAVYVSSTYRYDGTSISDRWRIEPIQVSISGGNLTVKGAAWMMARPVLYEDISLPANGINVATAANFMTTIDIYQRYTNGDGTTIATSQGVMTWESEPYPCGYGWCDCNCSATAIETDPAAIATAVARVGIRDAKNGIVIPGEAVYDRVNDAWSAGCWPCRQPDTVTIRSYAGYPLVSDTRSRNYGNPDPFWLDTVFILAAAELSRVPNTCDDFTTRKIHQWMVDLSRTGGAGNEEYGAISAQQLSNPLGTRRGQVEAWRRISDRSMPGSIAI